MNTEDPTPPVGSEAERQMQDARRKQDFEDSQARRFNAPEATPTPVKKAPAKKVAPVKAAAPVKKAVAKKVAPAKKAVAKKTTPVKKAASKKAGK